MYLASGASCGHSPSQETSRSPASSTRCRSTGPVMASRVEDRCVGGVTGTRKLAGGRILLMSTPTQGTRSISVEANGINVIADDERKGRPHDLFWPWFGANVSVLGLSYGAFILAFGVSFWQGLIAGVLGVTFSFLLCGFIAIAGKRGSAPTMILSR